MDFIPLVTEEFKSPHHLAEVVDVMEQVEEEPVRALISTPPQHGKSQTVLHGVAWLMDRNPRLRVAYITYGQTLSDRQARKLRKYAESAGVPIDPTTKAKRAWSTKQGGSFFASSIGGALTGEGFDLIIVDDPFKDSKAAESLQVRDTVTDWLEAVAFPRLSPTGSIVVIHTRWHVDDLIGRLKKLEGEEKWRSIVYKAIDDYGNALWPEVRSLKWLETQRKQLNEYVWSALYQSEPRVKGEELFREPARYEFAHKQDSRIVIACDPAASEKTKADFSAAVVLAVHGYDDSMRADVLEVMHVQKEIPEVCAYLQDLQKKYGCAIHVEAKGVGKAVPQFLRMINPELDIREIDGNLGDKHSRALPVSAAWNRGRVRVPIEASWLTAFLKEVQDFTGVGDAHDDQVDALAHAWNVAAKAVSPGVDEAPWHEETVSPEEMRFHEYIARREETLYGDKPTIETHTESTGHKRYGWRDIEWIPKIPQDTIDPRTGLPCTIYTGGLSSREYVCLECPDHVVVKNPVGNHSVAKAAASVEYLKAFFN